MKLVLLCIIFCSWAGLLSALDSIYRLDGHPDQYYSQTQEYKALSCVVCAAICNIKNCGFFFFQDGTCRIHDAGSASDQTNGLGRKYYLYDPSLKPQTLTNMAIRKPTLPDEYYENLSSNLVVDNDMTTQFHSTKKTNPWWSVDLGGTYFIRQVDVLPHPAKPDWFVNIKVFVGSVEVTNGNFSSYAEVGNYTGPHGNSGLDRVNFTPPTLTAGRYVAIQRFSANAFMALCDVKVMV